MPDMIKERIVDEYLEDKMKDAYLDYAMSVIIGRALPDVRDGLKPVHRRILFAMSDLGITHDKAYKKSARIVGEVIGKYHPHGDSAVYDSIVRMAQHFSMRAPLVDGQGNFGSVDGDRAAAMRYTEIRMSEIAAALINDLDKDTVDFTSNFDDTLKEPVIFPAAFPNLLVNGSSGIAVGMATNIPPHNLREVIDGISFFIDCFLQKKETSTAELMKFVRAPDFPTGGMIIAGTGVQSAYTTGRGKIKIRSVATTETLRNGRQQIIVTEIPYQVNKADLIVSIADLVKEKKVEGIAEIRDESDKDGMRIVIVLKKEANPEVILNYLFTHTNLETSFGIIMLALVDNQPRILSLKEFFHHYVAHRKEIVIRRTKFELDKAEKRAHILIGYIKALDNIERVIAIIRAAKDVETARLNLMKEFDFSKIQAQAILDMRLQRLTGLEREKIENEYKELLERIKDLKDILSSETRIYTIIKDELLMIKEKFGENRYSQIIDEVKEISLEDMIVEEDMVITLSNKGFIKRMPVSDWRGQRRGGRGSSGVSMGDDDFVENLFIASTHSYILFFTNKGKAFYLKVHEIPQMKSSSRGKIVKTLVNISVNEEITTCMSTEGFETGEQILMGTRKGVVKKIIIADIRNAKKNGIRTINLDANDELIQAVITSGVEDILICTKNGNALRTTNESIRTMGRSSRGVRGIKLKAGDEVAGIELVYDNSHLFVITEKGFGKRIDMSELHVHGRGTGGSKYINAGTSTGEVVGVRCVMENDEVMIISSKGILIRTPVNQISVIGRIARGMRVVKVTPPDFITSCARIVNEVEASGR